MADAGKEPASRSLVVRQTTALQRRRGERELEIESSWFALARHPWRTLVLVPVDGEASAADVAASLADVGRRLRAAPVTFLVVTGPVDYATAGRVVRSVSGGGQLPGESRLVVAIPPVTVEPLGLAVTDVADAIVLCVRRGRSKMRSARRTIELVGRDKIVGALVV